MKKSLFALLGILMLLTLNSCGDDTVTDDGKGDSSLGDMFDDGTTPVGTTDTVIDPETIPTYVGPTAEDIPDNLVPNDQ